MTENKNNEPEPSRYLEGYFLISETELMDPNFIRTVVLLIQHDDEGAFGLIVNRQTELTLGGIIDKYKENGIESTFIDKNNQGKFKFLKKLTNFARVNQFDIVHAFGGTATIYIRAGAVLPVQNLFWPAAEAGVAHKAWPVL